MVGSWHSLHGCKSKLQANHAYLRRPSGYFHNVEGVYILAASCHEPKVILCTPQHIWLLKIMKISVLAIVTVLAAFASAAPAPVHVVHEKRSPSSKWARRDVKINRDATIPMSIGLKQRNLDNAYELLMDISHPTSPNFGKHWSPQKV